MMVYAVSGDVECQTCWKASGLLLLALAVRRRRLSGGKKVACAVTERTTCISKKQEDGNERMCSRTCALPCTMHHVVRVPHRQYSRMVKMRNERQVPRSQKLTDVMTLGAKKDAWKEAHRGY